MENVKLSLAERNYSDFFLKEKSGDLRIFVASSRTPRGHLAAEKYLALFLDFFTSCFPWLSRPCIAAWPSSIAHYRRLPYG